MSAEAWKTEAQEMILEDMERWETYAEFDYFWSYFDVYKLWRSSLVEAVAARWPSLWCEDVFDEVGNLCHFLSGMDSIRSLTPL